jgi:hypothetical protein
MIASSSDSEKDSPSLTWFSNFALPIIRWFDLIKEQSHHSPVVHANISAGLYVSRAINPYELRP